MSIQIHRLGLSISCLLLLASPGATQPASLDALTLGERLDAFIERTGIPATGAALIRAGETPVLAVSGVRALDGPAVQVDDLWHIGSITKSFTATLTARLIALGTPLFHSPRARLNWDTRLVQLLPAAADSPYADVTVRQILGMRAGLPANPAPERFSQRDTTTPVRDQRRAVAEELLATEPTSEPGTAFLYSNAGYILLAAALEASLDASWEDLLQEHVLDPLELSSAGFGPPGSVDVVDQPRGHLGSSNDELRAIPPSPMADNPALLGPAGTLHLDLEDLVRYVGVHLAGALGDDSYLSSDLFGHLHEPLDGHAYASGWVRVPPEEGALLSGPVLLHNGSNTLWYAMVMFAPSHRSAAVVTTNAGLHNRAEVDSLTKALLAEFSGVAAAGAGDEAQSGGL